MLRPRTGLSSNTLAQVISVLKGFREGLNHPGSSSELAPGRGPAFVSSCPVPPRLCKELCLVPDYANFLRTHNGF